MVLIRRVSSTFPRVFAFANRSLCSLNSPGESLDLPTSSSFTHGIHVFHCPDAMGIVAKLSECIASRGGNILGADIFVPENKNVFYSRSFMAINLAVMNILLNFIISSRKQFGFLLCTMLKAKTQLEPPPVSDFRFMCSQFLFDPCKWPRMQMDEDFLKISKTFNAWKSVVRVPDQDPKYKIAILASKQDHCLVDLLHHWQGGKLPVEITCVISNHDRAPNTHVMRFLERHGIAYHYLHTYNDNKREGEILELVKNTDFLVLARYMQVLSGSFLRSYRNDAFNAGVKLIGATSHFVTEELDAGPIIEQMVERVSHRDNLQSFVQKSETLEKQCLTNAIKSYCELRVLPYEENRTVNIFNCSRGETLIFWLQLEDVAYFVRSSMLVNFQVQL
ncbi:Formyltetrahydrofolate deformylase 2, mitochondrial [Cucurbita argyrosperma subsp. argyrosperma]|nr:Formyltetrahydrofolate deformylase 2, mitochondrial [Cucurbita argyrosperma subsp. argyrosperma]